MPGQTQTEIAVFTHFAFAIQLSLGIVFLVSVLPKLYQPLAFVRSVVDYKILPVQMASGFAMALLPLEALLAVAFLTGWMTDLALPLAIGMLIIFLIAVGINVRRGREIPCGCFGNTSERISRRTLTRLLMLIFMVLILLVYRSIRNAPLPGLVLLPTDVALASMFTYLLQTIFLAAFLLLLGAWILSLPELIGLASNFGKREPLSAGTKAENRANSI